MANPPSSHHDTDIAPRFRTLGAWKSWVEEQADDLRSVLRTASQLRQGLWWQVPPAAPLEHVLASEPFRVRPKRKPSEDKFRFAEWFYFRKIRQLWRWHGSQGSQGYRMLPASYLWHGQAP
jgi:hypothetical protein